MTSCVEEMPSAAYWNMMGAMTQNSNQVGRFHQRTSSKPFITSRISSDVQLVLDNIFRLQFIEQAAKTLQDTAARHGPYED